MSNFIDVYSSIPELTKVVDSYRIIRGYKPIHAKEIHPRSGAVLMFDSDGLIFSGKMTLKIPLIGLQTSAIECETINDNRNCLVIKFKSWGLSRFISFDVSHLKNKILCASDIFGIEITKIHASIVSENECDKQIQQIESFLLSRYETPDQITEKIIQLAETIQLSTETEEHKNVRAKIPLSDRQLQRRFKSVIGIDQSSFSRICKFERAQAFLAQENVAKLSDISFNSGYYDQAHFTNEFKSNTAFSPGTYTPCSVKY